MLPVKVPLDGINPYLVGHPNQQIEVAVEPTRLLIQLGQTTYEALAAAMQMGVNVLESLRETPVSAVGINVKFQIQGEEIDPAEMASLVDHPTVDNSVSEAGLEIVRRTVSRGLKYGEGVLNLEFASSLDQFDVAFNFHKGTNNHDALSNWLKQDITGVQSTVEKILSSVSLTIEEIGDQNE